MNTGNNVETKREIYTYNKYIHNFKKDHVNRIRTFIFITAIIIAFSNNFQCIFTFHVTFLLIQYRP